MYICMYFLKRIINTTFSLLKVLTKKTQQNSAKQRQKNVFFLKSNLNIFYASTAILFKFQLKTLQIRILNNSSLHYLYQTVHLKLNKVMWRDKRATFDLYALQMENEWNHRHHSENIELGTGVCRIIFC